MTKEKDVLLQTRVPLRVGKEFARRAASSGETNAGLLRKLLIRETAEALQSDDFLCLGDLFIRKSAIIMAYWRDPNAGTNAERRDPWQLRVQFVDGTHTLLPTSSAKIVLEALGMPSKNPHPNGEAKK